MLMRDARRHFGRRSLGEDAIVAPCIDLKPRVAGIPVVDIHPADAAWNGGPRVVKIESARLTLGGHGSKGQRKMVMSCMGTRYCSY